MLPLALNCPDGLRFLGAAAWAPPGRRRVSYFSLSPSTSKTGPEVLVTKYRWWWRTAE